MIICSSLEDPNEAAKNITYPPFLMTSLNPLFIFFPGLNECSGGEGLFVIWVDAGSPPSTRNIYFAYTVWFLIFLSTCNFFYALWSRTNTDNVVQIRYHKSDQWAQWSHGLFHDRNLKKLQADLPKYKKWLNATFLSGLKSVIASVNFIHINNSYKLSP